MPALQSYWLAIHVTLVSIAEGAFMTSAVLTVLFLVKQPLRPGQRRVRRTDQGYLAIGNRLPAADDAGQGGLPRRRVRVPALHGRDHLRRDLGRGGLGTVLGLGPQGDLGVHRLGRLRLLPARPRDGRVEGPRRRLGQPAGFGAITFNFLIVNIVISGLHSYAGLN